MWSVLLKSRKQPSIMAAHGERKASYEEHY